MQWWTIATALRGLNTFSAAFCLLSCSSSLATVKRGPHRSDSVPLRVTEPSPPARMERIPLQRGSDCQWLDGQWELRGRNWQWVPGRWIYAPENCYYAAPQTSFDHEKVGLVLNYRPGRWYPVEVKGSCQPVRECEAASE